MEMVRVVAGQGVEGDPRYFRRGSRRQVTLIEREQIAAHAAVLGLPDFAPGAVRSNIETTGIDLIALLGQRVEVGEAVLDFHEPRTPCRQMDDLAAGLRELMTERRQGVLAQVEGLDDRNDTADSSRNAERPSARVLALAWMPDVVRVCQRTISFG